MGRKSARPIGELFGLAGPWRSDMTLYAREFLDSFSERGVEEIVIISSRQVDKTTTLENLIGYIMRQDPGPAQLVLPSEKDANDILERIKDMINSSPALAEEKTPWKKDSRRDGIQNRRMPLHLGWKNHDRNATTLSFVHARSSKWATALFL